MYGLKVSEQNLGAFKVVLVVKNPLPVQEGSVLSLGWEEPLEEGMATHSSVLVWRTSWTEEPGGQQSTGSKESDTTEATAHTHAGTESQC